MPRKPSQKPQDGNSEDTQPKPRAGGAPAGNKFWLARTKHGREKKFTPETLWAGCLEYFEWVHENPLWEDKIASASGEPVHVPVAKMRAMTLGGLCIFLDIDRGTWNNYRNGAQEYFTVTSKAEELIRDQKFAGAAADLLNSNIIARDLGLSDNTKVTQEVVVSHDFSALDEMDTEDLAAMSAMLDRAMAGKAVN